MKKSKKRQKQIIELNKAICQCEKCKGETRKDLLCAPCKALDDVLDDMEKE